MGHPPAVVLIGSPALTDAVAETRTTQVIPLKPLEGEEFAKVCGLVFGTCEPATIEALYESSAGLIGPLMHIARMHGL